MKTKEILSQLRHNILEILSKDDKGINQENIDIRIYENSSSGMYTLEEFFDQYNPEEIGKGQCNLVFRIDLKGKTITSFSLKDMYNCCGIIVGMDLFVSKPFRNKGLGTIMTKFMEDFSRYYGYGVIQGSDKTNNEHQIKIFQKLGWKEANKFTNPKTNNTLSIYLLNLNEN